MWPLLLDAGCDVRVLSRGQLEPADVGDATGDPRGRRGHVAAGAVEYVTGDLQSGAGIDHAVDGAARLVEIALGVPAGLVPDLAGPHVHPVKDFVRSYLRAAGKRRPILPMPLPGGAARAVRAGGNLALDGATIGKRTWEDFLAERVG